MSANYSANTSSELVNGTVNETALGNRLRVLGAHFRRAREEKRDAASRLRDAKKEAVQRSPEVFQTIEDIVSSAKEKQKARLRESNAYAAAEADKQRAASEMRAVMKEAKSLGVDTRAFKTALLLEEMDPIEREDHFDAIDIYAKALNLWGKAGV